MKRYLKLTQEATFNTYASGGATAWIRLDTPKSFMPMTTPQFWEIMSGSGFAVPALTGTATTALAATLTTPLHYSQWSFLMGAGLTRINAGQTSPWTTAEIAGDLASFTADFVWTNHDGSLRQVRYTGCKIGSVGLSGSTDSPPMRLSLGIVGSTPGSLTLAEPAATVFPTDPVLFQHLRSGLTVGSSRTNFTNFSFNVANKLKAYFDESQYANSIRLGGRRTTFGIDFRLKASPDDRADYEAATLKTVTAVFTNGTNTGTITLNTNNRLDAHEESMPLDEEIYYSLSGTNLLDTSATTDFVISYA